LVDGGEQGLLSVAFDPDFEANGRFYVYYVNNSGNVVIARYTANGDPSSSDDADESSAVVMTTVPHPGASNHNGGQLQIGPDGFLYAAIGDGGGGCDSTGPNAQLDTDARGKLLRIDRGATFPVDPVDAIWQKGLRNPFRFSFDRGTGDLYIGDVGQNAREEVDFQAAGAAGGRNYGWDCREGTQSYNDTDDVVNHPPIFNADCPGRTFIEPVLDFGHGPECSVTGWWFSATSTAHPAPRRRWAYLPGRHRTPRPSCTTAASSLAMRSTTCRTTASSTSSGTSSPATPCR